MGKDLQNHPITVPPIDLFEDIADPADWEAIRSAESKTGPGIAESVGMLDLVPFDRRVSFYAQGRYQDLACTQAVLTKLAT